VFDGATMIRTLHHMTEPALALAQVHRVMLSGGVFILEFANKRNLKAMLRYLLGKQEWSPYTLDPVEFAALNFDFHPKAVRRDLEAVGFTVEKTLAVSHFRMGALKRAIPLRVLVGLDKLLQRTGGIVQLSPSVFLRAHVVGQQRVASSEALFQCPLCQTELQGIGTDLRCGGCGTLWPYQDGIYDFRVKNDGN